MGGGVYYTRAGMLASTSPPLRLVSFTGHVIPRHRILADKKCAAMFHPRVTYSFQNYLAYPLYPRSTSRDL
ncbi:hypothetical protein BGW80DRAFT_287979 [Lactifluus volemus]|nr:hypothetical protein BGW80DRAFT_287979 [Lactifluus volemus]